MGPGRESCPAPFCFEGVFSLKCNHEITKTRRRIKRWFRVFVFSWPGFSHRDGMTGLIYFLFFCSGLSGLIYQVVWVRVFGNVFGNTIYSASLVVATFMLGLGIGSYAGGVWADRRYTARPESLLGVYGYVELIIAVMGFGISSLLPHI